KSRKALKASNINAYSAFQAPHTFLNESGGPYRTYCYETFSLQEIKAVSRSLGGTVNDLVLTLCSEAIRRYFLELGQELPQSPLVVAMPVANKGDDNRQK